MFLFLPVHPWLLFSLIGGRWQVARLDPSTERQGLLLMYLGVYKALGYGAHGSNMYLDPLGEPGRYLSAALGRVPALIGGLLGAPVDFWRLMLESRPALVGVGVAGLVLAVLLLRSAWPGLSEEERRHGRWLLAGSLLSLHASAGGDADRSLGARYGSSRCRRRRKLPSRARPIPRVARRPGRSLSLVSIRERNRLSEPMSTRPELQRAFNHRS